MSSEPDAANTAGFRTIALLIAAMVVGGALGWLCSRYVLVGSAWTLLPWAVAGIGVGLGASNWRIAAIAGALYGFVLGFVFMISGYQGSAPLNSVLLPFAALGAVAAVAGIFCAELGWFLRRVSRRQSASARASRPKD